MANVPTPEQIKQIVRSTHPAERQKVAINLHQVPVKAAANLAQQVVAKTTNQVNELNAEVERLTKQLAEVASGLQIRKRMSPQDLRDALNGLFETYNFSPAEELVMMLKNPAHPYYIQDVGMRTKVLFELQAYVMPKLKSTEITGEVKHKHTIVIKQYGPNKEVTTKEFVPPPNRESIPVETVVKEVTNGN